MSFDPKVEEQKNLERALHDLATKRMATVTTESTVSNIDNDYINDSNFPIRLDRLKGGDAFVDRALDAGTAGIIHLS